MVFLSELRHVHDSALKLRVPLGQGGAPEAVDGQLKEGVFQGVDFRGVRVISVVRRIPETDWHLVAKIDADEAFDAWHDQSVLIVALMLAGTLIAGGFGLAARQREKRLDLQSLLGAELARRSAMERYRTTIEAIGDGVIITDAEGRVELLNPVAEALTGWTHAEGRGRPLAEVFRIVDEETRATVEDPVAWVLREGAVAPLPGHSLLLARDGVERPIAESVAPIRGVTGAIDGVVLVFRDQSDERRLQRYGRMVEEAVNETFVFDAVTLRFVDANRAARRNLGYTLEELRQLTPLDLKTSLTAEAFERLIAPLRSGEREQVEFAATHRRKDGTTYPVDVHLQLHGGARPRFAAFVFDATERNRTEAELVRVRAAVEQAGEAVLITDAEGAIVYVNPAFERVTGYRLEEALGQTPRFLKSGVQDDAFYRQLWGSLTGGETFTARMVNRRKDGSHFTEDATISPVRDRDGRIVNFVAVKRDVTEALRLEAQLQQAQKMESIGRLAGGVAHDYNNILGVILGYADIALRRGDLDPSLREELKEIHEGAQRAVEVTRQLLAFARKQAIRPVVLDLNGAVEGTLRMLRRLIGEEIELTWRPGGCLWKVRVDPTQIDQILANLCVNARDAIAGTGRIEIETRNVTLGDGAARALELPPGDFVALRVVDDGDGMTKETLKHLFEPFYTTKEPGQGTGLGLATVYGIVKQHEGHVEARSEPGQGSTFEILLPRDATEAGDLAEAPEKPLPRGGGEVVLLVEDEAALLQVARRLLEELGYVVLPAGSPEEGLRVAAAHPGEIRLLITDVVMPRMNGRQLAEALAASRPGLRCLYMSGYTADVIAHRGVLESGIDFIQKPFDVEGLAAQVRAALDRP